MIYQISLIFCFNHLQIYILFSILRKIVLDIIVLHGIIVILFKLFMLPSKSKENQGFIMADRARRVEPNIVWELMGSNLGLS